MAGCANGADPTPAFANLQRVLGLDQLDSVLRDVLTRYAPTALATYAESMIDVNALCALNPDPPEPLSMLDFVKNLTYIGSPLASINPITQYIFRWLQYHEFQVVCVCRAVVPDPGLNCVHATNVSIPSGSQQIVPLGTATIEEAVYNTWTVDSGGNMQLGVNLGAVFTSGQANAINWHTQVQGSDGVWVDMFRGDAYTPGGHTDYFPTIQQGLVRIPRIAPLRIRTDFGSTGVLSTMDTCFIPLPVAMRPQPPQPPLPDGPTITPPTCSTDDLCAIVLELGRQLTRVSSQVADIQATVGGTDQFTVLASQEINGEGQLELVVGTRAVSIELTTIGSGVFTSALGRPRGLMRAGSIRWGDGEGYSKRQFIDADDFTRLRPQGSLSISWQLINECAGTLRMLG